MNLTPHVHADGAATDGLRPAIQGLVLVALGLFLYSRLANGTLYFYIHARFAGLTLAAALGLILVGAAFAVRRTGGAPTGDASSFSTGDDPACLHGPDCGHDHGHAHGLAPWLGLGLIALPIVLGLLVPPRPLGASAMANRDFDAAMRVSGGVASERRLRGPVGERNILDWLVAFQSSDDPAALAGQPIRVTGFVFPPYRSDAADPAADGQTFMVGRFIVSCCAADATPVGLAVRWPAAADLAPDTWVEVAGTIAVEEHDGRPVPSIDAERVTVIEAPNQPYLYP